MILKIAVVYLLVMGMTLAGARAAAEFAGEQAWTWGAVGAFFLAAVIAGVTL